MPKSSFDALAAKVSEMEAKAGSTAAEAAVDAAIKAGKVSPAQREWALGYAAADPDGFAAFAKAAPAILPSGAVAPAAPADGGARALSPDELAACRAMGIDQEKFVESRKRLQAEEAD